MSFSTHQWLPLPAFFVVRLILASYCCGWIIYSGFYPANGEEKWFIYLTNWGYLLLTVYLIWATILTAVQLTKKRKDDKVREIQLQMNGKAETEEEREIGYEYESQDRNEHETSRWYHKGAWVIYSIASCNAVVITVLYWSLLYSSKVSVDGMDISTHLLNTVFVLLELMLSALTIRFLHVIYPCCFGAVYVVFTAAYWAISKSNVYPVLDYEKYPVFSGCLVVGVVLVAIPLSYGFIFGLFKLRCYLQVKFEKK